MDIRKMAVSGAIFITGIGIAAIAVLAGFERPISTFVQAFLSIAGFLTAVLVLAFGQQKAAKEQGEKLDAVLTTTNGINSALLKALLTGRGLTAAEIDVLKTQHTEQLAVAEQITGTPTK